VHFDIRGEIEDQMAVSFRPVRVKEGKRPDARKADEMILWGRIFDRLYMAPYVEGKGSAGNMAFRAPNGICITPSGGALGSLRADEIMTVVDVKEDGGGLSVLFYGHPGKAPSSETLIYWDIFKRRRDVNAVLHGHDSICLEKTDAIRKIFPADVSETRKATDAGSFDFVEEMRGILSGSNRYLVGKGHGFFALGKDFEEAGLLALKLRTEATGLLLGKKFMDGLKEKYDIS